MTRRQAVAVGVGALMLIPGWAAPAHANGPRTVRAVQDIPDLGLTFSVTQGDDGSRVLTGTAGDLNVRKRVYADGTYAVSIAQGDEEVVISATGGGTRVSAEGQQIEIRADARAHDAAAARRVRGWLARSEAVQQFRRIVAALDDRDVLSVEAMGFRITGAVVSELIGDPGAARRLSRGIAAKGGRVLRRAQSGGSGYKMSCWDIYHRLVTQAANQLESCLDSFSTFNPTRHLCVFVWTMQVESAWFQFLACSSFPLK